MPTMISAASWIRKGFASATPKHCELTEEEYDRIMKHTGDKLNEIKNEKPDVEMDSQPLEDDDMAKFNMDAYSEDEDVAIQEEENNDLNSTMADLDMAGDEEDESDYETDPEDADDLQIRITDSLIVACRTTDDLSYLDVYVYEEDVENIYIHHDIMMPSFPLAVEWIQRHGQGNFAAVATFEPEIEIWDLDVLEAPYPSLILGASQEKQNKASSYHTDAVMSLSWNKLQCSMLASSSADCTVKLWDVNSGDLLHSFDHLHSDKIQAVQWSPYNASILATASYDGTMSVVDCRLSDQKAAATWSLSSDGNSRDPECLCWNPHREYEFAVSDEHGFVTFIDTRCTSQPRLSLSAHSKAVTSLDWNSTVSNCLLTASLDRSIKLWRIDQMQAAEGDGHGDQVSGSIKAECVAERSLAHAGKIMTASFSPDLPHLVMVAGSKGTPVVLNLLQDKTILDAFGSY